MINNSAEHHYTAFLGERKVASGNLEHVVSTVKDLVAEEEWCQLLIFHNLTSNQVEVDFRGTKSSVLDRLKKPMSTDALKAQNDNQTPGRGRPKLGVVPGEITLLPRHWEWLKNQPGGASVTIRKLVDEARRLHSDKDTLRHAQEATYRFMTVMAGNHAHYEEALRALYAGDSSLFDQLIEGWPADIREHTKQLAARAFAAKA